MCLSLFYLKYYGNDDVTVQTAIDININACTP